MSVVGSLRRQEDRARRRFQAFLDALKDRPITVLLFGSRAQGTATPLSDYDLLVIYGDAPVAGRGLTLNLFNLAVEELEGRLDSPLVVAALLTGRIVLDNLSITSRLARLIEDLKRRGARVEADRILLPRRAR